MSSQAHPSPTRVVEAVQVMDQLLVLVVPVAAVRVQLEGRLAARQAQQTRVAGAVGLSLRITRPDLAAQAAAE